MKKYNKNKKAAAYAFGEDEINAIGALSQNIGVALENSTDADSNANVAGSSLSGLGTGAALGASVGSIIPGIGTAIGGAVGAVGGAISGLFTGLSKKRQYQARKRRENFLKQTQNSLDDTANMMAEYWDNNTQAYTYNYGGIAPNLAYLDNNEVIRDTFGNLHTVPNTKSGTDNHLVNSTNLESVLSDKIKRPGTNKTYADLGKNLTRMTKSTKGKDKYAENSRALNKFNANLEYEKLLAEQELVKAKKGIKPKTKSIPAYEDGSDSFADWFRKNTRRVFTDQWEQNARFEKQRKDARDYLINYFTTDNKVNNTGKQPKTTTQTTQAQPNYSNVNYVYNPNFYTPAQMLPEVEVTPTYVTRESLGLPVIDEYLPAFEHEIFDIPLADTSSPNITVAKTTTQSKTNAQPKTTTRVTKATETVDNDAVPSKRQLELTTLTTPGFRKDPVSLPTHLSTVTPVSNTGVKPNANIYDKLVEGISKLSDITPTIGKLAAGIKGPETEEMVNNPYASSVINAMLRRRYNILPAMEANRRSRAIGNYNLNNLNSNTGANLAALSQLINNEYLQNSNIYGARENANNALLGEYANTINSLGQQYVQARTLNNDINARNRAAARNQIATGLSELSSWGQRNRLEENTRERDLLMLPFLSDFLREGYTTERVNDLINRIQKRR